MVGLIEMLRSLIFACITILLSSCTVKNDQKDRVNFEELSKELFSAYGYTYKLNFRKEILDESNVYIDKNHLSKRDFTDVVEKKLLEKGWKKIPALFDDQYMYCYDRKNAMSIVYPTQINYRNKNGNSMSVGEGNLDKWVIFYGYDMYGTTNCKNYFKNNLS